MAARAAMSSMYQRLGFSLEAAGLLVDDQGMDTLEELSILTDEECDSLCKLVRRPGGTIPNPNVAVADAPARIPNPGLVVPMMAVTNLKLACYFACRQERTSRVLAPGNVTLANVRNLRALRLTELAYEDPTSPNHQDCQLVQDLEANGTVDCCTSRNLQRESGVHPPY